MRLSTLDLIAFGPFSGVTLDLSTPAPGLHVVYGPNEAGKSTTLRAVRGLLFGIPIKSPDAHAHATKDLRIGGCLRRASGETLSIIRRKGRKDTLLDSEGRPLDEAVLAPFLGGVNATLFEKAFGLDHESLRSGAEAMLAGGGEVGESLFGASVGGQGIHKLLLELREEADQLFTPLGRTRKLVVQGIADVKEQKRRVDEYSTRPDSYVLQKRALDEAYTRRDRLRQRQTELKAEQSRLLRILKVLSPLGHRASVLRQIHDLGQVPDLPADARDLRVAAERERQEALGDVARFDDAISERRLRLDRLRPPERLLDVDERVVGDIDTRLGRHRAAEVDLPKVKSRLQAADEDVRKALAAVRPDLELSEVHGLRPTAALVARVRLLANRMGRLSADLEHAGRSLAEHAARSELAGARLRALPPAGDLSELERALSTAEHAGDLEAHVAAARRDAARARARGQQVVARLGDGFSLETLRASEPPSTESIEHFEREWSLLEGLERRADEQLQALKRRRHEAERDLAALTAQGDVATESQLVVSRGVRDGLVVDLGKAGDEGAPVPPDFARALEGRIRDADAVADRLRREADRAARHAALVAELQALDRMLDDARADLARVNDRAALLERDWIELWKVMPVAPQSPAEMRAWMHRHAEADRAWVTWDDANTRHDTLVAEHDALREALKHAAERAGVDPPGAGLGAWVSAARQRVTAARHAAEERRVAEEAAHRLDLDRAAAEASLAAAEKERDRWQVEWSRCMGEVGLAASTPPEEALAVLDALGDLFQRVDAADALRRRIEGMQRDSADLARDVGALCRQHLPDALELPFAETAQLLVRRFAEAHADARTRVVLEEELEHAASGRAAAERRHREGAARLEALCLAAGVESPSELEGIERRAETARALGLQLARVEEELLKAGGGVPIADLLQETEGITLDAARARLNELDADLTDVMDELSRALQDAAERSRGVEGLEGGGAAAHALELQHRVSRVEGQTRRYFELRLAERLLDREIERFRREHQGPVLARASEIFPRLTRGRYGALVVGFDDEDRACLRCVRMDGTEVGVEALSDGTRDQLFLALRLATLERQAARGEPMPLVLDDALVHFDDDRAAAALGVLGEVARTCQVLFFTHHARLVELARESVSADTLAIHRLPGA